MCSACLANTAPEDAMPTTDLGFKRRGSRCTKVPQQPAPKAADRERESRAALDALQQPRELLAEPTFKRHETAAPRLPERPKTPLLARACTAGSSAPQHCRKGARVPQIRWRGGVRTGAAAPASTRVQSPSSGPRSLVLPGARWKIEEAPFWQRNLPDSPPVTGPERRRALRALGLALACSPVASGAVSLRARARAS
jgi:hypothetical protein